MAFNRFDICAAWCLFASEYHSGQFTELCRVFGRLKKIGFRPGPYWLPGRARLPSNNAKAIYDNLVEATYA